MGFESIIDNLRAALDKGVLFPVGKDLCVIIRKAEVKDIPGIHALFQQIHHQHVQAMSECFRLTDDPVRLGKLDSQIHNWIKDQNVLLIVAEESDELRGALCAYRVDIPDNDPIMKKRSFVKVDTLVVREDSFGLGIGRRLMEDVLQWTAAQKLRDIELSVFQFNERAIDFYEHLGFSTERQTMKLSM